ncbi:MAG: shikimate kinase [candidate division Zixibacteria bacterium]|nr:shikimate kinase [candidate division Zixibacteria bacterium]
MPKPTIIFLAGFAGSGKTTVGRLLARRLKWEFHDLDDAIVKSAGRSVASIFAGEGERAFRRCETATLKALCKKGRRNAVIALGGGTLLNAANRAVIQQQGQTVYLSCSRAELYRRLRRATARPLLKATSGVEMKRRIGKLLAARIRYYRICDLRISVTGKSPQEVAREVHEHVS